MPPTEFDPRSAPRRAQDEQIASEQRKTPLDLPSDTPSSPLEAFSYGHHRPKAVAGVVENGVVRPIDPAVILPEHARVIIVTSDQS